jgi:hypothetical protein
MAYIVSAEIFWGGIPPPPNFVRVFVRVSCNLVRRNFVNSYESSFNAVGEEKFDEVFKLSGCVKKGVDVCTLTYTAL